MKKIKASLLLFFFFYLPITNFFPNVARTARAPQDQQSHRRDQRSPQEEQRSRQEDQRSVVFSFPVQRTKCPGPLWRLDPVTWLSPHQWNVEGCEPLPGGAPHPPPFLGYRRAYFVSKVRNIVYPFSCTAGFKENALAPKIHEMACNIFSSLACKPEASTNSEVQKACRATWWGRYLTAWNSEMCNKLISFVNPPHLPH